MKTRIIKATVTAVLSLALYPLTNLLALTERGYQAIGGEEALLVFGLFAAAYIAAGVFSTSGSSRSQTDDDTDRNNENN